MLGIHGAPCWRIIWRTVGGGATVAGNGCLTSRANQELAIKSLITIILSLAVALYFTDLDSSSTLHGVVLPVVDFLLFCSLAIWLVNRGMGQRINGGGVHSGGSGGFFDGGGDGGGGCD